jgi:hypothetical protein
MYHHVLRQTFISYEFLDAFVTLHRHFLNLVNYPQLLSLHQSLFHSSFYTYHLSRFTLYTITQPESLITFSLITFSLITHHFSRTLYTLLLLNPAKQSKQAKQASKQANQQIGLG